MTINADTKIGSIIKQNPKAMDVIISIHPKFEKLRNPILRKLMAGRTSIAAASKIAGCTVKDFYDKLQPLGFDIDYKTLVNKGSRTTPQFIKKLQKEKVVDLDVRPVIASGSDPLQLILAKTKRMQPGDVLKIINTFEPTPLILLLQKKGFETYVDELSVDHYETYFYFKSTNELQDDAVVAEKDFDSILKKFDNRVVNIDVRALEMPHPMINILESLDNLKEGTALYVHHKRIPVFLLPELAQKGFEYRIKEISDGEVLLLIYKK